MARTKTVYVFVDEYQSGEIYIAETLVDLAETVSSVLNCPDGLAIVYQGNGRSTIHAKGRFAPIGTIHKKTYEAKI